MITTALFCIIYQSLQRKIRLMENEMKKIFLFIVISAITVFGQLDRSKMPTPAPASEIKLGDYSSFQLDNGLKVFVVENTKLPRVSISLVLHRDPIMEKENAGYVEITGQLLRTATKSRTKEQIDEEIDFLGANLSTSSTGAFGSSLKKNFEKLLDIFADVILNPEFKQEELDKIKKQYLSSLQMQKDDPNAIAENVSKVLNFGKEHPYGEIVTEETVNSVTTDLCKNYYQTYFRPNIGYLAIVGDITKSEAEKLVKKYFAKWEKKDVPTFTYSSTKAPLVNKVAVVDRPASVQSVIEITYPIDLKKFNEEAIKATVMNHILGGNASARLFRNLREDKAFTYGAYSSINPDMIVGSFTASCEARNSVTDSAVTEFLNEMKRLRNEKVSEEELKAAINFLSGSFARSLENPQTIASFALNIARYNLPKDYYKNYLKTLNSVTVEDIQQMAKKYLKVNNANILVVGNADEVANNLKKFSTAGKVNYFDMFGNPYDPSAKKLSADITPEVIFDKFINAIGGKEKVLSIKDRKMVMKGKVQGLDLTIELYQKQPNKLYQLLDAGVMKQESWFDGTAGKTSGMGQEINLEGDELELLKSQASMNLELDYKSMNIVPELTGIETFDGKDSYRIKFTLPNKKSFTRYYDVQSGLLVRAVTSIDTPQGSFSQTTIYDDYKEVGGVKFPFKMTQGMAGQNVTLDITSIEVNKNLDDSIFQLK